MSTWFWDGTVQIGDGGQTFTTGSGDPNGGTSAPIGSVYLRIDGAANAAVYIKESGVGNTGWTAIGSSQAVVSSVSLDDGGALDPSVTFTLEPTVGLFRKNKGEAGFSGSINIVGSPVISTLATPGIPTVTPTSGTATLWAYKIAALDMNGDTTLASSSGSTSVGASALDSTHYNTITWNPIAGASSYKVYRVTVGASPSTTGVIGTINSDSTLSLRDNGLVGGGEPLPVVNTTSKLVITSSGASFLGTTGSTLIQASSSASGTLTLPAVTDTLIGKATTDNLTNKTFNTADAGNILKINGTTVIAITGSGSVVLATSSTLTNTTINQAANGDTIISSSRFTDSSPSGNFLNFKNTSGGSLFTVDTTGTLTTGSMSVARLTTGTLALARGGTNADLSGTGGASQVLRQSSSGAAITVSQLAASDLSNGSTGSGVIVLATSPSITTLSVTSGGVLITETTAPSGSANKDILYGDSTAHRFKMINNNGSADTVVGAATSDTFTNKTLDTAGSGNTFKINGTTISAITGTGSAVLATSPSITTPTVVTGLTLGSSLLQNDTSRFGTTVFRVTPSSGNNTGGFVIMPSGTATESDFRMYNTGDPVNTGTLDMDLLNTTITVSGIGFGTGTAPNLYKFDSSLAVQMLGGVQIGSPTGGNKGNGSLNIAGNLYFNGAGRVASINYVIDGGGSVPTTGAKGQINIPMACTLTGWVLTADASGSAVVDVLRSTYAGFPTTSSIAGSDKPTLSSVQKNENLGPLSGWGSTALSAGDQIQFNVNSITTCQRLNLTLNITIP